MENIDYLGFFIGLMGGVISSIIAHFIIKKHESTTPDHLREYKSIPFYLGVFSLFLCLAPYIGLILSFVTMCICIRRIKNSISKAYNIAFFMSFIGFSVGLALNSVGFYIGYNMYTQRSEDDIYILNTDVKDRSLLRINNVTTTPLFQSSTAPGYWNGWVTAKYNDTLSFCLYYHNAGEREAEDVILRFGYNQYYNAVLCGASVNESDSRNLLMGYAGFSMPSDTSSSRVRLDLVSAVWYPEQKGAGQALPFNQSGAELFQPYGLFLGNVKSGWEHQGSVVITVVVHHAQ